MSRRSADMAKKKKLKKGKKLEKKKALMMVKFA